jgi:hypothetical protein
MTFRIHILRQVAIGSCYWIWIWCWLWPNFVVAGFTTAEWESLEQGQVLVRDIVDEHDVPGVKVMFLVRASRDDIWATLVDYDNFQQFFPGIDRIQVLKHEADGALVEFWVDAILTNLHYVLYRHYIEPGYRLIWERTSGDLKDIHGSWQILDTSDIEQKLLIYESFVDIGFTVGTWAIRIGARNKAQKMGISLRVWIEKDGGS